MTTPIAGTDQDRIRTRDRDAILASLRAGVVPRVGQHHIQVGRAPEVTALLADIDRIADGGSGSRFVIGEYGSGKTFFLHLVRSIALQRKLVTVHADLSPDRRLHATGGQARSLYAELMRNMATRAKPDGGAMPNVVERFVTGALTEAKATGQSAEVTITARLASLTELTGGYDFAEVVGMYWQGHDTGDEALKLDAVRWLRGEFATRTDARAALGVRTIIDDANFYDQLKLLARFVRLAGFDGLLVCLDEMVNLYKLANTQARNANYEQILRIVNDSLQGSAQGLGFVFGGTPDFLMQDSSGLLLHGRIGERLANHHSFYSAFTTSEEYRLLADGRTLGSLPVEHPLMPGTFILFGGRRWQVVSVDTRDRVIQLTAAAGGRAPAFTSSSGHVDHTVRRRMRQVYSSTDTPRYLDATAADLLDQGRRAFHELRLHLGSIHPDGNDSRLFPWAGDKVMNTLAVTLATEGVRVGHEGVSLSVSGVSAPQLHQLIAELAHSDPPAPEALAATVSNTAVGKYDEFLSPTLAARGYAASQLDVPGAWRALTHIAAERPPSQGPWTAVTRQEPRATSDLPVLGRTPFSVIDVETTGFAAHKHDRIVEVAVVSTDPGGRVTDSWHTLINPDRDPGASDIHGITAEQLAGAPRFADVLPFIASRVAGTVVVAHNALFDLGFLSAEFLRAGQQPPVWPALCTMELAAHFTDSRRLHDCCHAAGITPNGAHTALGDATATASLLEHYLRTAPQLGIDPFEALAGADLALTSADLCDAPPLKPRSKDSTLSIADGLPLLAARAAITSPADLGASAYLDVLAGALRDVRLSDEERLDLRHTAQAWGLDERRVAELHRLLIQQLAPQLTPSEVRHLTAALTGR